MKYLLKLGKILVITFIGISFLFSCSYKEENEIREYIKLCASDLIQLQLDSSIRKKDYVFKEQNFTMYIDSTGKPTFFESEQQTTTIILNVNENRYIVALNDGIISVDEN